jgi:uncharacterized protein (DUF885 family)
MRNFWKGLGIVALVALVVGAYAGYRIAFGTPFTLKQLANRQALLFLVDNPELFTTVGIADGTVFDRHSGKLAEVGVKKRDADYAQAERFLAEVRRFDRAKLGFQDQLTFDVLVDQYATGLAFKPFEWASSEGLYPIAPMWGTQVQLINFLETQHVVKNAKTAENYVLRLVAAGGKLDAVTAEMQRQAALGVILPLSLLERAESGIDDTVKPAAADNPLVTTFVARMQSAQGFREAQRADLARRATDAVATSIYPAFARMKAALDAQRPAAASQGAGVGRLPGGAAYYAASLKQMTTTDYTPEQVHALGLSEVSRINAAMDALLRAQGIVGGTVAARVQALHKDPRFLLPNTDAGRGELLAKYQAILDEVGGRLPGYFRTLPPTKLTVERVPAAAEKGSAAAYYQPAALDGSRAGTFFANLRDVGETATWTMKTLAYHEGIPGHHLQIAIAQNLEDLPLIRQEVPYAAFSEGWALYAEQLAAEMGMYRDDPYGDIGRLEAEMFRAARLVVDTGLHSDNWTREQAIAYMVDTTGMNESEVVSEVERYMGMPGQACAYKVGELKILELRERARLALGPKFDLKDFHSVVLENGSLPLTLLEKNVDRWIAGSLRPAS